MYCLDSPEAFSNFIKLNTGGNIYETYKNLVCSHICTDGCAVSSPVGFHTHRSPCFLTDSGYEKITRIGDLNGDNNLDIKDATLIQKCLAGVEEFDAYNDMVLGFLEKHHGKWERYISDFNRDGVRNVKDATAIQKHIAGLEY